MIGQTDSLMGKTTMLNLKKEPSRFVVSLVQSVRPVPMTNYFSYIADNGSWITYFIALPLPARLNINISLYHIPVLSPLIVQTTDLIRRITKFIARQRKVEIKFTKVFRITYV